jgi:hypothetical protein
MDIVLSQLNQSTCSLRFIVMLSFSLRLYLWRRVLNQEFLAAFMHAFLIYISRRLMFWTSSSLERSVNSKKM